MHLRRGGGAEGIDGEDEGGGEGEVLARKRAATIVAMYAATRLITVRIVVIISVISQERNKVRCFQCLLIVEGGVTRRNYLFFQMPVAASFSALSD